MARHGIVLQVHVSRMNHFWFVVLSTAPGAFSLLTISCISSQHQIVLNGLRITERVARGWRNSPPLDQVLIILEGFPINDS